MTSAMTRKKDRAKRASLDRWTAMYMTSIVLWLESISFLLSVWLCLDYDSQEHLVLILESSKYP